jgi:hypothetical protein
MTYPDAPRPGPPATWPASTRRAPMTRQPGPRNPAPAGDIGDDRRLAGRPPAAGLRRRRQHGAAAEFRKAGAPPIERAPYRRPPCPDRHAVDSPDGGTTPRSPSWRGRQGTAISGRNTWILNIAQRAHHHLTMPLRSVTTPVRLTHSEPPIKPAPSRPAVLQPRIRALCVPERLPRHMNLAWICR